ncbi:MAG: YbhB/YbcL family Raf kinase inhibitor-like protein [Candidatus Margulisiibacteriota bacterium]
MKKYMFIVFGLVFFAVIIGALNLPAALHGSTNAFTLESPAFFNGRYIPKKFSCDGENVNPELVINNIPAGTKSLALLMFDPEAPSGIFVHWVVYNIPPSVGRIREGSVPSGAIVGLNSEGKTSYIGPCPPPPDSHQYTFVLYGLDIAINQKGLDKNGLEAAMQGHVLDKTTLIGLYRK